MRGDKNMEIKSNIVGMVNTENNYDVFMYILNTSREDLVMTGMVDFNEERVMWKGFVHTAEFDDQNVDKINDNWCLDFVHRNAVMKWKGGNKN